MSMRAFLFSLILVGYGASPMAQSEEIKTDDNSAFFQGERRNYIFHPPPGFKLIIEEAGFDGYSFAFLPESESYTTASILVTVTIYKLHDLSFQQVMESDTAALRAHYGKSLSLARSTPTGGGLPKGGRHFSLNDSAKFIPTRAMHYLDSEEEILIFELSVSDSTVAKQGEESFTSTLSRFRSHIRKELGTKPESSR